ncbi:competence protein ComJ [Luteimonas endophytica]|uniref:competence protein ComJ n=1 Tax=Luteimonas endophytica TaxID=3042023 RepID=UPI003CE5A82E
MTSFNLFVSYSQIAVFWPTLENPFSSWTEGEVERGFTFRPGSVSFKTTTESGDYSLEVFDDSIGGSPNSECVTSVEVPFEVPENGEVEIASISDGCVISVTPGTVQLRFEELENNVVRISFLRKSSG